MILDARTMILIIGISDFMQMLVLFHQFKVNNEVNGPGWWLLWNMAQGLGFSLMLLRSIPGLLPFVIVIQTPLLYVGGLFFYIGIMKFFGREANYKIIAPFFSLFIILHYYFFFISDSFIIRAIFNTAYFAVISFLTAISALKYKNKSVSSTANFCVAVIIVNGLIFSFLLYKRVLGYQFYELSVPDIYNYLTLFDAFIVSLLLTFSLIIMLNQRLHFEMSEAKEDFEYIFHMSPEAIVISRLSDGEFVDCNASFIKMSGYTKEELVGKTSLQYNYWVDQNEREKVICKIKETGSCENYETMFQLKKGEYIPGLLSVTIITLRGVPYLLSIIRDITERKAAEEKIKLQNIQLSDLNSEKDKFFSIIAHDLRSPFHGFLSMTELLAKDAGTFTSEKLLKFSSQMHQTANNLYALLKNLLEWSQMQQGAIPFQPKEFLLNSLIENNIEMISRRSDQKGIRLINQVTDSIYITADEKMVSSVLLNLLSNAVKFTRSNGVITVNANITADRTVEVSVTDTGIGMDNNTIGKLFKIGEKIGGHGTDGELSTGLGLLLCKEFVEKHGGRIWAESEKGKGSVFKFTLALL